MRRRRAATLAAFFLMTTAALAPAAFQIGKAHGARLAANAGQEASYFGPYETVDNGGRGHDCPELGTPGFVSRNFAVIDCRQSGSGGGAFGRKLAQARRDARAEGLQQRYIRKIAANGGAAPSGAGSQQDKVVNFGGARGDQTAPAAQLAALSLSAPGGAGGGFGGGGGSGGGFGGGGSGLGAPTIPNGSGVPLILSPAFAPSGLNLPPEDEFPENGDFPDNENPPAAAPPADLVTPIPAGAPIFLTGAALLAAARRKRRSAAKQ